MARFWPTVEDDTALSPTTPLASGDLMPDVALAKAVALRVNAPLRNADMEFHKDVESRPTPHVDPISQVCIRHIVNRANRARIIPKDYRDTQTAVRLESVDYDFTTGRFWQSVFEAYLTEGNIIFFRNGDFLCFSHEFCVRQGDSPADAAWDITKYDLRTNDSFPLLKHYDDCAVASWDASMGTSTGDGDSPVRLAEFAAETYQQALELLHAYCTRGHKIGAVLQQDKAFESPDKVRRYVESVAEILSQPGNFMLLHAMNGFSLHNQGNGGSVNPPDLVSIFDQSASAVARVFGVPVQLIGLAPGGQRALPHELETHLLNDAVFPMLDTIGDAVAQVVGGEVDWDMSKVGRPGFAGMAGIGLELAQMGAITINELRATLNYKPLEGGERLPETAGSGYRNDGQAPKQEKVVGADKKPTGGEPKKLDKQPGASQK